MTLTFRIHRIAFAVALIAAVTSVASAQMNKVVALVKGEIVNQSGAKVPDVSVQVYKGSEKVNTTKSTSEGTFQVILTPGTEYKLICSNAKYYYHEQMLSIPTLEKYQIIPITVPMRALEIGTPYPFTNMVFEPKSSTVSPNVASDLDQIAAQMKRNGKLTLSVTVYPDVAGTSASSAAETELANARKNAIAGYFMSKGLSASSVAVTVSTTLGPGKFERMITKEATEVIVKGKKKAPKKKKGKAPAPVKMMVPQTADVVMKMGF